MSVRTISRVRPSAVPPRPVPAAPSAAVTADRSMRTRRAFIRCYDSTRRSQPGEVVRRQRLSAAAGVDAGGGEGGRGLVAGPAESGAGEGVQETLPPLLEGCAHDCQVGFGCRIA